jgi:hypothetical protein
MQVKDCNVMNWPLLIEEQSKSGLSKAAFCRQKGVKAAHFYYQQTMLKQRHVALPTKLHNEESCSLLMPIAIKKIESTKLLESLPIRFLLKNGMECIVPSTMDMKCIKAIVEVLVTC